MSSSIQWTWSERNIPRMIVARPRAVPIPLPLMAFGPTRLNLIYPKHMRGTKYRGRECNDNSHRRVLQHVWDDEEPDHAPPDIHLV